MNEYANLLKNLIGQGKTDFEIVKAVLRFYNVHPGRIPLYRRFDKEAMRFIIEDIALVRRNAKYPPI